MSADNNNSPNLCLAHIILSGTSGWALRQSLGSTSLTIGTFTLLLGHSLIGVVRFGFPDLGGDVIKTVYEQSALMAQVAAMPMLTSELFNSAGLANEWNYFHIATAVVPMGTQFLTLEHNDRVIDASVFANLGSLIYLAVTTDANMWTQGIITLSALNNFIFKNLAERYDVSKTEMMTLGLVGFSVLAANSLSEA